MSAPRTRQEAEAVAREVIRQRSAFGRAADAPRHGVGGIAGPSTTATPTPAGPESRGMGALTAEEYFGLSDWAFEGDNDTLATPPENREEQN